MGIRWGTSDLTDEQLLQGLDSECSTGVDAGAFRRQLMFKAVKRILELLLEIRRGLPAAMLLVLFTACATAPEGERKPFYYYHTNYPEQIEAGRCTVDCDREYRGFSDRERSRRLQRLYDRMD